MVLVVMLTVSWGCRCDGIGSNVNCILWLQMFYYGIRGNVSFRTYHGIGSNVNCIMGLQV